MASKIYLRGEELQLSDAKKAADYIDDAVSALRKVDDAVSGWDFYMDNIEVAENGFVFGGSMSEAHGCLSALRAAQTRLNKLVSTLQTATEKIEDADAEFKNSLTNSGASTRRKNALRSLIRQTIFPSTIIPSVVTWIYDLITPQDTITIDIDPVINVNPPVLPSRLNVDLVPQPTHDDCGPTSAYMLIKYLNPDSDITLEDVIKKYNGNPYLYNLCNIIVEETDGPYHWGANLTEAELLEKLQTSIESGYPCMALGASPTSTEPLGYTSGGHYFVVSGVFQDTDGTWMVEITDPYSEEYWKNNNPTGQVITISLSDLHSFCHQHPSGDGGYLIFATPS